MYPKQTTTETLENFFESNAQSAYEYYLQGIYKTNDVINYCKTRGKRYSPELDVSTAILSKLHKIIIERTNKNTSQNADFKALLKAIQSLLPQDKRPQRKIYSSEETRKHIDKVVKEVWDKYRLYEITVEEAIAYCQKHGKLKSSSTDLTYGILFNLAHVIKVADPDNTEVELIYKNLFVNYHVPTCVLAYARWLEENSRIEEALTVVKSRPDFMQNNFDLAYCYARLLSKIEQVSAYREYEVLLERFKKPKDRSITLFAFAICCENLKNFTKARSLYEELYEHHRGYWKAMIDYAAFVQKYDADYEFSLSILEDVIAQLDRQKPFEDGKKTFIISSHAQLVQQQAWLDIKRHYAIAFHKQGIAYKNLLPQTHELRKKAREALKKAIEWDPTYAASYSTLEHLNRDTREFIRSDKKGVDRMKTGRREICPSSLWATSAALDRSRVEKHAPKQVKPNVSLVTDGSSNSKLSEASDSQNRFSDTTELSDNLVQAKKKKRHKKNKSKLANTSVSTNVLVATTSDVVASELTPAEVVREFPINDVGKIEYQQSREIFDKFRAENAKYFESLSALQNIPALARVEERIRQYDFVRAKKTLDNVLLSCQQIIQEHSGSLLMPDEIDADRSNIAGQLENTAISRKEHNPPAAGWSAKLYSNTETCLSWLAKYIVGTDQDNDKNRTRSFRK